MPEPEDHRKTHPSLRPARNERARLRLVQGPGVVPLGRGETGFGHDVVTAAGRGSLADLLAESGPLAEPFARGIGARVARTLARVHAEGTVHGDVKPANIVFSTDDDLWLIDFDAAGRAHEPRRRGTRQRLRHPATLAPDDDVTALAIVVVECATGIVIDPTCAWTPADLEATGCSPDLAADLALVLHSSLPADRVGAILQRRDDRLPAPPRRRQGLDPTPTVDIPSVAVAGLEPLGGATAGGPASALVSRDWRRRERATRG